MPLDIQEAGKSGKLEWIIWGIWKSGKIMEKLIWGICMRIFPMGFLQFSHIQSAGIRMRMPDFVAVLFFVSR